jgi:PhzF family phenazine biosynthesis protein
MEVPLCGHATLAAAHVLFTESMVPADRVVFDTLSGAMTVEKRADGWLEMDFPLISSRPSEVSEALCAALGARPIAARIGHYRLAQFATEEEVRDLKPDIARIARLEPEGEGLSGCIVCVAPGAMRSEAGGFDVVSRFFAPGAGVPEDPATGSAHCMIAPVYSQLLGREDLHCFQAFPGRGAVIRTRCVGDRVRLAGEAVTVIEGRFRI